MNSTHVDGDDTRFSGAHFVFAAVAAAQTNDWRNTIDPILALKPEIFVPGHQITGAPNDATVLSLTKK